MNVSCCLHALAVLPQRKEHELPFDMSRCGCCGEEKNSSLLGIKLRLFK
jgi:hypothetical protein